MKTSGSTQHASGFREGRTDGLCPPPPRQLLLTPQPRGNFCQHGPVQLPSPSLRTPSSHPCRCEVETAFPLASYTPASTHPHPTLQPTLCLRARETRPHHSRALEHSAAQILPATLPWRAHAPWPGFKAPPSELSPLWPHLCTSALPEPLSECSPFRNPLHYSLLNCISRSLPPESLLTPSPFPAVPIMCLQNPLSPPSQ